MVDCKNKIDVSFMRQHSLIAVVVVSVIVVLLTVALFRPPTKEAFISHFRPFLRRARLFASDRAGTLSKKTRVFLRRFGINIW